MTKVNIYAGFDVSKKNLDLCLLQQDGKQVIKQFGYDDADLLALAGTLPEAAFSGVRRVVGWRLFDAGLDPTDVVVIGSGIAGLALHESRWQLEWMESPWDEVDAAGDWLLELERRRSKSVLSGGKG